WSRSIAPEIEAGRFFEGEDVSWRIAPFILGGILPFALLPFADIPVTDTRVVFAAAMVAIIIGLALTVPWSRLPAWTQALLPLCYFVILALLRDASDGSSAIFDPLVSIPVVWFAVYGTGRELAVSVVAMAVTLILPIVVGAPSYGSDQLERAAVWIGLAVTLAPVIHLLVRAL